MVSGIWEEFLKIAREEVGSRVVETWFKAISLQRWDMLSKEVHLKAPNGFVRDWIYKHYLAILQVHLGRLLRIDMPKILFVDHIAEEKISGHNVSSTVPVVIPASVVQQKNILIRPAQKIFGYMNKNYSFSTFVVGPHNSLAYAAAQAVTEKPDKLYNPLFIYGGSGLGKTHLLHAIGNEIQEVNKHIAVVYQTADRFVNEFIHAIRFDKIHKFQLKYQNIDLLLIDDVQFISNKEQTQEAFFHIFNALYDAHKQIVFSSDTYPQNMKGIAERLRSRFSWGLVADIYMPSLETKVAILKKKVALNNENIDDDVAYFIATHTVSNIRELEGALIRVLACASLNKQPVTLELAKRVLTQTTQYATRTIDFQHIMTKVCRFYPCTVEDLQSKSRNKDVVIARHVAMFLMKSLTDKSLRDIGDFFGGRDHSTVMHALEKVEEQIKRQPELQQKLRRLEEEIMHG